MTPLFHQVEDENAGPYQTGQSDEDCKDRQRHAIQYKRALLTEDSLADIPEDGPPLHG